PQRLVETSMQLTTKPLGKRWPRRVDELLNALEPQFSQGFDITSGKSERRYRQNRDRLAVISGLDCDGPTRRDMPCNGVSTARSVGNRDLHREPGRRDATMKIL
ncbi:hypothetical protein, partial [Salmonella enterica]|uniref:hypothetical protein n=1 Tax=Salmonella enterica TaxID=28901 RepID=UPI003526BF5E